MTKDEFETYLTVISDQLCDDITIVSTEFLELARLGWEFKYGKGAFMLALDKIAEGRDGK